MSVVASYRDSYKNNFVIRVSGGTRYFFSRIRNAANTGFIVDAIRSNYITVREICNGATLSYNIEVDWDVFTGRFLKTLELYGTYVPPTLFSSIGFLGVYMVALPNGNVLSF